VPNSDNLVEKLVHCSPLADATKDTDVTHEMLVPLY